MRCPKPTPTKQAWGGRNYLQWRIERFDQSGEVTACLFWLRMSVVAFPTAMPLLKVLPFLPCSRLSPVLSPFFPSLRQHHTAPSTFSTFFLSTSRGQTLLPLSSPRIISSRPQLFVVLSHWVLFPRLPPRASEWHLHAPVKLYRPPLVLTLEPRTSPILLSLDSDVH